MIPVEYPYTNETLEAIMAGLDMQEGDRAFAICGSGDQAFALLEYADSVSAVDFDESQTEYAQERKNSLAKGRTDRFLWLGNDSEECTRQNMDGSIRYFETPGRLEKIGQRLDRLEIKTVKDFLDELQNSRFTKVYLSNAITFRQERSYESICEIAKRIAGSMEEGGLLYISDYDKLEMARNYTEAFVRLNKTDRWPKDLVLESELTLKARVLEKNHIWLPAVYRRKAQ
ncbi:MAG: hypothetical protein WC852_04690 [Candidatus Nanoarchaeia archaeon]|jgi:hypothetical protein